MTITPSAKRLNTTSKVGARADASSVLRFTGAVKSAARLGRVWRKELVNCIAIGATLAARSSSVPGHASCSADAARRSNLLTIGSKPALNFISTLGIEVSNNNRTQLLAAIFSYQMLLRYNHSQGRHNAQLQWILDAL